MAHGRFRHSLLGRSSRIRSQMRCAVCRCLRGAVSVAPQNLVNELHHRPQPGPVPHRPCAPAESRSPALAAPSADAPPTSSPPPGSYRSMRVLPSDLFKQFHLASPVHRPPRPLRRQGRPIYRLGWGQMRRSKWGQIRVAKSTRNGKHGRRRARRPRRKHLGNCANPGGSTPAAPAKKKLSYREAQYSTIEQRVEEAEQLVKAKRAELEDPANAMDAPRLVSAQAALDAAQEALERPLRAMGGTGEEERVSSPGKPMSVTGAIACGC